MTRKTLGELLKQQMGKAASSQIESEEQEALNTPVSKAVFRGTDGLSTVDKGGWLSLYQQADQFSNMEDGPVIAVNSLEALFLSKRRVTAEGLRAVMDENDKPSQDDCSNEVEVSHCPMGIVLHPAGSEAFVPFSPADSGWLSVSDLIETGRSLPEISEGDNIDWLVSHNSAQISSVNRKSVLSAALFQVTQVLPLQLAYLVSCTLSNGLFKHPGYARSVAAQSDGSIVGAYNDMLSMCWKSLVLQSSSNEMTGAWPDKASSSAEFFSGLNELYELDEFHEISNVCGQDMMHGGSGDDVLCGRPGAGELIVSEGRNMIALYCDEDLIVGEAGDDRLFGQYCGDTFDFSNDGSSDLISDFVVDTDGVVLDVVEISGRLTDALVTYEVIVDADGNAKMSESLDVGADNTPLDDRMHSNYGERYH